MDNRCPRCQAPLYLVDPSRPDGNRYCPSCSTAGGASRPSRAFLVFAEGMRRGESIDVPARMVIGRVPGCDLVISDSDVSRRHAEIVLEGERYCIRDLGSRNGIEVCGEQVASSPLDHGNLIRIGDTLLRFELAIGRTQTSLEPEELPPTSPPRPPSRPPDEPITLDKPVGSLRGTLPVAELFRTSASGGSEPHRKALACLGAIYRVSEALVGILEPDRLLDRLLEVVLETMPADRAYALLRDETTDDFVVKASRFREERHAENQWTMSRTILQKVVTENVALLVADASEDERFGAQRSIVAQGIRSIMCVPLAIGPSIFGVVAADTLRSRDAFDEEDLKMLTAIARQASVGLEHVRLIRKVEEDTRTRGLLERFLSPELVDQAVSRKLQLNPGGELKDLTILFSDIRGFTGFSERMEPSEVVELLNEYFGMMVEVVFRHGGTLDKFIGDSIMAFWGAPVSHPDDPVRAVSCALEMQEKMTQFNALAAGSGQPTLPVGIGINTGPAVVGNLGSARRYEYTVIGDPVNVASRVQQLAQPGQVLITGSTRTAAGDRIVAEEISLAELKGRQGRVPIYQVSRLTGP
ncbi:MAG: FHA domain-containing protein [Candidatus Riflebacteria bacterium]|nr:FHA domain-containing protein [Candidatus Riflebacteria bacterium]